MKEETNIQVIKHRNKGEKERVEFLFIHYDYYDGNEIIAKLFCQEYQMMVKEKIDGIHYNIIRVYKDSAEYNLIWHEDVGNCIYSTKQDIESVLELEEKLGVIVHKLNKMINLCQ